jgi:hypothetical protein
MLREGSRPPRTVRVPEPVEEDSKADLNREGSSPLQTPRDEKPKDEEEEEEVKPVPDDSKLREKQSRAELRHHLSAEVNLLVTRLPAVKLWVCKDNGLSGWDSLFDTNEFAERSDFLAFQKNLVSAIKWLLFEEFGKPGSVSVNNELVDIMFESTRPDGGVDQNRVNFRKRSVGPIKARARNATISRCSLFSFFSCMFPAFEEESLNLFKEKMLTKSNMREVNVAKDVVEVIGIKYRTKFDHFDLKLCL